MQELQAEDFHKISIPAQTKYFKTLCYSLGFWFHRRTFNITGEMKLTWILLAHFLPNRYVLPQSLCL
jgi:hypothetical protein